MKTTVKLIAVLLLACHFSYAQSVFKRIDSIVNVYHQKNPNVGISVGFVQNHQSDYTAYGNLDGARPINQNSIFEIASITKILTSNLIAQAVIEQRIQLADYIDNFLPKAYVLHPNLQKKIRIADLASHQSGLPDVDFGKLIELDPQQPIDQVTEKTLTTIINNCTELTDHGKYRYSTIGYTLLGQILETVYHKPYDELLRDKILQPLKLKNTLTKNFEVKNSTTGHNADGGMQEFLKWNVTASAGLVKSSAADMVAFLKAVLDQEHTIGKAAMVTEKIYYKDKNREMGLGTNVMTDEQHTIYSKSGDSMGQSSIICYNRTKKWGIIILLDQRNSKMRQNLLNEIYGTVLK